MAADPNIRPPSGLIAWQATLVKAPTRPPIRALFSQPGFVAQAQLAGVFGDRYARVIRLRRRKKLRGAGSAVGGAARS